VRIDVVVRRRQRGEPPLALLEPAADQPRPRHRDDDAVRDRDVGGRGAPQRQVDLVGLGAQAGQPAQLLAAADVRLGLLHEVEDERGVRGLGGRALARRVELLARVGPDRLQHAVAGGAVGLRHGDDERLVHQRRERLPRLGPAHPLGRGERGAARERAEPPGDGALGLREELPAPVDDRAQRLVAGERGAHTGGEQAEPVVEAVGDLLGREGAQAGGGQLDGERLAVEAAADLGDGGPGGGVEREAGPHGGGPVDEELDGVGFGERVDGVQHLARHPQRLAAGGEHPQAGARGEQGLGQRGDVGDEVLAVVEHEDRVAAVEGGEQPGERLGHLGAAQVQLGLADGGQHGLAGAAWRR
jgi:hypothetical protein